MDDVPGIPKLDLSPPQEQIPAAPEPLTPEVMTGPAPGEPVKRKRHRRTKAELEAERAKTAPPPPATGATTEDLDRCRIGFAMIFGLVSNGVAKRLGPEQALTEEEIRTLAGAWTDAVAPYLPSMGKNLPMATAAVATVLIAIPRWQAYQATKVQEPTA